eukprot:CAMPEP_0115865544 /NCGR_PEP_ID=MMETSP0287-20121206/19776_1 /TAXON_ID=412157 /ORGANISM="Chrysochromulina rotalis, Strain UIO044" /LENGTH=175 /DNA_ID=CAMNT_0003320059 /DNA_START=21 /DNA_END=548 /DNA_ORIENTATION=+
MPPRNADKPAPKRRKAQRPAAAAKASPIEKGSEVNTAKRAWTEEEDNLLTEVVERCGTGNWNAVAAQVGRNQKRCRERWFNHLDTQLRKGPWTEEEDALIDHAVAHMGHRWMEIAKLLPPGRSGEAVKNRYKRPRQARTSPVLAAPLPQVTPIATPMTVGQRIPAAAATTTAYLL